MSLDPDCEKCGHTMSIHDNGPPDCPAPVCMICTFAAREGKDAPCSFKGKP